MYKLFFLLLTADLNAKNHPGKETPFKFKFSSTWNKLMNREIGFRSVAKFNEGKLCILLKNYYVNSPELQITGWIINYKLLDKLFRLHSLVKVQQAKNCIKPERLLQECIEWEEILNHCLGEWKTFAKPNQPPDILVETFKVTVGKIDGYASTASKRFYNDWYYFHTRIFDSWENLVLAAFKSCITC